MEQPPTIIVVVQSMMYISLFATLLAALLAVLGKQWLVYYQDAGSRGTIEARGLECQRKLDGLVKWKYEAVLQGFPLLLQLALLLLASSTSVYLWTLSNSLAILVTNMSALGLSSYVFLLASATIFSDSAFQTPMWPILAPIKLIKSVLSRAQLHWLSSSVTSSMLYATRTVWQFQRSPSFFGGSQLNILPRFTSPILLFTRKPNSVPVSPEVPAVLWVLNTSTNPAIICLAAELGASLQWPLKLGQSGEKAVNCLETTLLAFLDDDGPLRVGASSVNLDKGSPENTYFEFINGHSLNRRIVPDSWDPFAVGAGANSWYHIPGLEHE
ncbi:hypothetical protein B0H16DRAFT_1757733 [Mycena metata]|uniref:DUF6535 domain-containing protein n=1 Tax=Mycena metata TaxID=1033252 RepID=A0AAD7IDG4_9AGAR|nr:hypothetical protein B0H16DRAFT_1757733 [Mycena metata]